MNPCPTCGTVPVDGSPTCAACGTGTVATRRVLPMPQAAPAAAPVTQHYAPQQHVPPTAPPAYASPAGFDGYPGSPGVPGQTWPTPPTKGGGLERKWWVGIAAAVVVLGVVGHAKSSSHHTVYGSASVYDHDMNLPDGSSCDTYGGYSDVAVGTNAYLTNASGTQIGRGVLGSGTVDGIACVFHFTINDVPDSSEYGISVGHRNTITFSRSEMEDDDWSPGITLGDD